MEYIFKVLFCLIENLLYFLKKTRHILKNEICFFLSPLICMIIAIILANRSLIVDDSNLCLNFGETGNGMNE